MDQIKVIPDGFCLKFFQKAIVRLVILKDAVNLIPDIHNEKPAKERTIMSCDNRQGRIKRFATAFIIVFGLLFFAADRGIFADQPKGGIKETPALSGKVVETMDSGRYTYVCLEKDKKKIWVAVYKMKVNVGQSMSFKPGVEMVNFESKTLNRKFDKIIFSTGPIVPEGTKNETKPE